MCGRSASKPDSIFVRSRVVRTLARTLQALLSSTQSQAYTIDNDSQPCAGAAVCSCTKTVTSTRFERRLPPGRLEPVFREAFGTFGKAACRLRVTRQTIARWARLTPPPPRWVLDELKDIIQKRVEAVHFAQNELKYYMAEPPRPPRKLSGCCAGYQRREKRAW